MIKMNSMLYSVWANPTIRKTNETTNEAIQLSINLASEIANIESPSRVLSSRKQKRPVVRVSKNHRLRWFFVGCGGRI